MTKACPPSTIQLVLGVLVDTVNGTLVVPDDKMEDIKSLLAVWKRKRKCNKMDFQSNWKTPIRFKMCKAELDIHQPFA